jgi:undecaprenyl pyrophosphate phosphatase UppP
MDAVLTYATEILLFVYVIIAPAMVLGKVLYPKQRRPVRFAVGLAINISVMPTAAFGLAMATGGHVSTYLLLALATVMVVGGLALQVVRLKRRPQVLEE